jgi:nitrite reductase (NADH) small subunit/3-phenylpropionate/trans-cinnamate dioxygenase ferredoxin subunit
MDEFVTVCKRSEIPADGGKTVLVGDKLVAIFDDRGTLCAITDTCPHMGASLGAGCLEDGIVTCPWHGWRFRVADGAWADNPKIKVARYGVRQVGEDIQIKGPPVATGGLGTN